MEFFLGRCGRKLRERGRQLIPRLGARRPNIGRQLELAGVVQAGRTNASDIRDQVSSGRDGGPTLCAEASVGPPSRQMALITQELLPLRVLV